MCSLKLYCIDPPAITAIQVIEACTNDFTISWTAPNNEEELSYTVTIFPPNEGGTTIDVMDTSYKYTEPKADTTYNFSVASRLIGRCLGSPTTIMVTTLAVAQGIPGGELFIANLYL